MNWKETIAGFWKTAGKNRPDNDPKQRANFGGIDTLIAAIIGDKPEHATGARRPNPLLMRKKRASYRKTKRPRGDRGKVLLASRRVSR